ncbi:fibroblast growth factor 21-like [Bombina bombina]|uniref:fibroblast growth factor 21-like n=1 Tax=Bombina bombina TaxID=8345 RepID=UPI00235B2007|nr:fibroblast growth factor 21-like [Bombina bombina]
MKMVKGQFLFFSQCPLLSRFILCAFVLSCSRTTLANPFTDSNPILDSSDQVRLRHLYTGNAHTHLHLQISPEGVVSGTQEKNLYSLLEIKAVKPSILVMRGMMSSRYLCMDSKQQLYGSVKYIADDCNFQEVPLTDGYNLYFSEKHPAPLTLTPLKGGLPSGKQMTHFLPLKNTIPLEHMYNFFPQVQGTHLDAGSEDPLGMINMFNIISPSQD